MINKKNKYPKYSEGTWMDGITTGLNVLGQSYGKPVTVGGVVSGIGQGAATGFAVGGPMGAAIGAIGGGLLSSIGTGASVDESGYNVQRASGLSKLFGIGKSNSEMYAEANRK